MSGPKDSPRKRSEKRYSLLGNTLRGKVGKKNRCAEGGYKISEFSACLELNLEAETWENWGKVWEHRKLGVREKRGSSTQREKSENCSSSYPL